MYSFEDIIGNSKEIRNVKELAMKVCNSKSPIFVYGDTGTGKELIVQAIHNSSIRRKKPFIAQNCAAIPDNLLESIFFGVGKGGFTGAIETEGLFDIANGGTLYLDELNSMDIVFQGKFLRVLQEGEFRRIGETNTRKTDIRIIASVNENPDFLVKSNKLRKDLYYRLNVIRINMPELNARKEDIPILVSMFIEKHNKRLGTSVNGIDSYALEVLMKKDYDGNVRELEHIIEGALNYKRHGIIEISDLQLGNIIESLSLKDKLVNMEIKYIKEALIIHSNNVSKASKFLNIPRQTLQYKITKYNIMDLIDKDK
ncbi:sigma-54 interaction domain-containing protein [Clostridium sulfidigenes]|uniref:sigma-54 interaction domain-containing protein n=1 Tax=Clostridium sulfidigenes TaxID=318464 RepID=UPI000558B481|nr:sigma-54-dependent Fis family transcriptional regulator [Clostridium sulfidigenes]